MIVLSFCDVAPPHLLFDKFWRYFSDDIVYKLRIALQNPSYSMPESYLQVQLLTELSVLFSKNGLSLDTYNLSPTILPNSSLSSNRLISEELSYDLSILRAQSISLFNNLNSDQLSIYNTMLSCSV